MPMMPIIYVISPAVRDWQRLQLYPETDIWFLSDCTKTDKQIELIFETARGYTIGQDCIL